MPTLLLRLAGPMQSWGTRSRFDDRDTERMPSKSGVIGMLCAAQGRGRGEPVDDLAALRMGVRADRPGILATDFHTALNVAKASGSGSGTVISRRHYLADAVFLVGLEGPVEILEGIQNALKTPRWPLFLGRKGFPLSALPLLPHGLRPGGLEDEMSVYPWLGAVAFSRRPAPNSLETQWECLPMEGGETRQDVPLSFAQRLFTVRRIRYDRIKCPLPLKEDEEEDVPE